VDLKIVADALNTPTEDFNFASPQYDPIELVDGMVAVAVANRGLGLAANQVGLRVSVLVFGDPGDPSSYAALFNPRIIDLAGEAYYAQEGCLSFPGLWPKVKRSPSVRVRYADRSGVVTTELFQGVTARVVQHEIDHLLGITFIKRATKFHIDQARRQARRVK